MKEAANNIIKQAEHLERKGQVAEALQYLMGVGAVDQAVSLLLRHKRYVDAARLRLQALKVSRREIHQLPEHKKRLVAEAAAHLEKGQEWSHAAELYLSLNRPDRARLVYEQALLSFASMTKHHHLYRESCLKLIQLAITLDYVSFELDHILRHFIKQGPQEQREQEFFYQLGNLYMQNQQYETAEQVLTILLKHAPQYRDARELINKAHNKKQRTAEEFQQALQSGNTYAPYATGAQGQPLPLLEELPHLPGLPEPPAAYIPPPQIPQRSDREDMFPMLSAQLRRQTPPPPSHNPYTTFVDEPPSAPLEDEDAYEPKTDVHDSFPMDPYGGHGEQEHHYGDLPYTEPIDPGSQTDLSIPTPPPESRTPATLESDFLYQFSIGAIIAERYRIIEQIGQGGMATVFCAFDDQLDEKVALKVFDPFYSNEESLLRFKREIKLNRKLSHPNVIRLHDLGSHQQYHYISMELLRGRDLETIQMDQGVFDIIAGTKLLLQVCSGLQAAHDLGVIHRDIKLSNFFLTEDDVLKVMDFGIAIDTHTTRLTATGNVVGTGAYMAPERAMGEQHITPASDLYSLGVMAFEMFTGQLPFYHQQVIPLLMMHVHNPPPHPRQLNNQIPESLANIILRLLAKKPEDRYGTCRELALALRAVLQHR